MVLFFLWHFDPNESEFFPKCPFFVHTGLKCPGCGTQRALHELLRLRPAEAFGYNAMAVIMMPVLAAMIAAQLFRDACPRFYVFTVSPGLSWSLLALVLLWWLGRNIFGW